ncbi:hypothetical protein B0T25DRAFT_571189 [Lasiosphaeria hispida]|uniref:FAD-binding domain-containing protein n=1 Tax=Lasiosphaeria hispida TaxID=260671 RepID=A0AAJ0HAI4_9PEZI|nr:hypothetical protein B0T25DRAFT_571189 [Lasiosphaeria hispida]
MPSQTPHVLIIGAGIGGLTLAQCLRKQGVTFEVFERDASASAKGQGYCVGLHDLEGLFEDALPDDLPPLADSFHLRPLPLPSQAVFHLPTGRMLYVEDTPETPCLRVNRLRFRQLLSTGVDINWGKKAAGIEEDEEKVTVVFEDGTSATGDLVVGADGAFSGVRPYILQKPNEEVLTPYPTAAIFGETKIRGEQLEQQLQLAYSGYLVFGPDFTLFCGANCIDISDDGEAIADFYWLFSQADETIGRSDHWLKTSSTQEKLAFAAEKVQALDPKFRAVVESTTAENVKPYAAWWDALIPEVPPGAIFAIRDAVQLSKVLGAIEKTDTVLMNSKLNDYQKDVVSKGYEAIVEARTALQKARTGTGKNPLAWGHESKVMEKLNPLPIQLSGWKP